MHSSHEPQNHSLNKQLLEAARKGQPNKVKWSLEAGADVNAKDNRGNTPLLWAAFQALTSAHLAIPSGDIPSYILARNRYAKVAKALIYAGADVNARNDDGDTPLLQAAWNGRTDLAKALIYAGADVNARNDDGDSPLHHAASGGFSDNQNKAEIDARIAIIRALTNAGANVNARNNDGHTPLNVAERKDRIDIVKALRAAANN